MSVVDAHHHLWDPATGDNQWLDSPGLEGINRAYTLDDLRAVAPADVEATVLVQTLNSTAETERLLAAAAGSALVAGVVAWVDLTSADVGAQLDRLAAQPGGTKVVGIRHLAQDEPDPRWLAREDVARGVAELGRRGLTYDVLVRAPQRAAALELARAVPDVRLVLDHAGKPGIGDGEWDGWASWLTELAAFPNVDCKLSGLLTEAAPGKQDVTTLRPYAEHVLGAFGPDRVLYGSDWPVCELAGGYPAVWASTQEFLAGLSEAERTAVRSGTARRAYALP
ncbi:amidohydrolase family protein [Pseudonocardia sp. TRM90224]|uniref:amidohydrolase family protein n=1 Tax=Pseudonocardia sp. TRM90224 TaxID=2812678 RepID=UPI001E522F1A|nr:amidohydrolase family protein [Pseudonocardia sp. TRM90224]